MAFFVVRLAPGLTEEERARVVAEDPAFLDSPRPYQDLMADAGFSDITEEDVTAAYRDVSARWLEESGAMEPELRAALGDRVFDDKQARRRRNAGHTEAGLIGRSLITGTA